MPRQARERNYAGMEPSGIGLRRLENAQNALWCDEYLPQLLLAGANFMIIAKNYLQLQK